LDYYKNKYSRQWTTEVTMKRSKLICLFPNR
jgi:hypothetical protein